jgi:hypothetical protein
MYKKKKESSPRSKHLQYTPSEHKQPPAWDAHAGTHTSQEKEPFFKAPREAFKCWNIPRWGRKQCKHKGLLPLPHFQPEPSLELATALKEIFEKQ